MASNSSQNKQKSPKKCTDRIFANIFSKYNNFVSYNMFWVILRCEL